MTGKSLRAVVCGSVRMNHEGPIAGLQKQQLPAGALHHGPHRFILPPGQCAEKSEHARLGSVFDFPDPFRLFVEPDSVIAVAAPTSFGQAHDGVWHALGENIFGSRQLYRLVAAENENHIAQKIDSFVPPVPKQLGVKRRNDHAGPAGVAMMFAQRFAHHFAEMVRIAIELGKRPFRQIRLLLGQVHFHVRNPMIPQPAIAMAAMKFHVCAGTGIPDDPAPDLLAHSRMPSHRKTLWRPPCWKPRPAPSDSATRAACPNTLVLPQRR